MRIRTYILAHTPWTDEAMHVLGANCMVTKYSAATHRNAVIVSAPLYSMHIKPMKTGIP